MLRNAKNVRLAYLTPTLVPSGSNWLSPCLSLALYGSLWLPLWLSLALTATLWHTLALSGSLLLSNFALDQLTGPLLGSQHRCNNDALSPALTPDWMTIQWANEEEEDHFVGQMNNCECVFCHDVSGLVHLLGAIIVFCALSWCHYCGVPCIIIDNGNWTEPYS